MVADTPYDTLADSIQTVLQTQSGRQLINLGRDLVPEQLRDLRDGLNRFYVEHMNPSEADIRRNSYRNERWREFVQFRGETVNFDRVLLEIFSSFLVTIQSQHWPIPQEAPDLIVVSSGEENYEDTYFPDLNLVIRVFEPVTDVVDN